MKWRQFDWAGSIVSANSSRIICRGPRGLHHDTVYAGWMCGDRTEGMPDVEICIVRIFSYHGSRITVGFSIVVDVPSLQSSVRMTYRYRYSNPEGGYIQNEGFAAVNKVGEGVMIEQRH